MTGRVFERREKDDHAADNDGVIWENKLLSEEQREHAETFSEGHTDDGLHEDLGSGTGIATDGFGGLGADEADADGGAEETEGAGDVASDFSEDDGVHVVDVFLVAVAAVRTLWHAPDGKGILSVGCFGVVTFGTVIIAVVADEPDINGAEERKDERLNQADEQLHEIEDEKEAGAMEEIFPAENIAE